LLKNLLENAPKHFFGSPFSTRGVLVGPNHRSVDERPDIVDVQPERLENRFPTASSRPPVEAVVDRFPAPVAFGQVAPLDTRFDPPDNGIDEISVTTSRTRTGSSAEERPNTFPL